MSKRKPSWKTIAKKQFGKAATYHWGDGRYAFVTPCREVHYSLWQTIEEAEKRKGRSIGQGVEESVGRGRITSMI